MKKIILMLTLLIVVVLCYSCNSFVYGGAITSGYANSINEYESQGTNCVNINDCKNTTYSDCVRWCNEFCRNVGAPPARRISLDTEGDLKVCRCDSIPRDLSNLPYIGTTSSEDECRRFAVSSGYLSSHYKYGKCYVDNKFYSIGTDMTKIGCQELARQTEPRKGVVYVDKTQTCYVVETR